MAWDDFWGGVRDRIDAPARRLSLITVTRDAQDVPRFAFHLPGTDGGARNPQTGYISSGRTAHEAIYPIAAQLSLVTPATAPDGGRYFAPHIPLAPGAPLYQGGRIGNGEQAGETVQRATDYVTNTVRETVTAIAQPIGDASGEVGQDLLKGAIPIALIAAGAYVAVKVLSGKEAKA